MTPSIAFSNDRFEASSLASVSEWAVFGWAGGAVEDILTGSEWEPEDTNLKVATQLSIPDFFVYFNSKWDHNLKNDHHVILWLRPWTHQGTVSWIKWVVRSSSHKIAYNPLFGTGGVAPFWPLEKMHVEHAFQTQWLHPYFVHYQREGEMPNIRLFGLKIGIKHRLSCLLSLTAFDSQVCSWIKNSQCSHSASTIQAWLKILVSERALLSKQQWEYCCSLAQSWWMCTRLERKKKRGNLLTVSSSFSLV